ncbi:MAG: hypothetical protein ACFHWZ_03815 [Phycisphaerales bacterium]
MLPTIEMLISPSSPNSFTPKTGSIPSSLIDSATNPNAITSPGTASGSIARESSSIRPLIFVRTMM